MQRSLLPVRTQEPVTYQSNSDPACKLTPPNRYLKSLVRLTLRQKTLLFLGLTLTALVGGLYFSSSKILSLSLKQAEQQSAEQTIDGVLSVLGRDKKAFSDRYQDWSAWDDTYTFVQDRNVDYIKSNLIAQQFSNLKINLVLYIQKSGKVVFGSGFDLRNKQVLPVPQALKKHLSTQSLLLAEPQKNQTSITGLLMLPEGPILITSQPIVTSEGKGPIQGVLVFGRYLDDGFIADLSQATQFPLKAHRFDDPHLPEDFQVAKKQLVQGKNVVIQPLSEDYLAGYVVLSDLYQQPGLILRVDIPRKIYQQGHNNQLALIIAITLVGLVFGGVSLALLERFVLSRLAHLSQDIQWIQSSRDLSLRVTVSGQDELSNLAEEMNQMLSSLETSQQELRKNMQDLAHVNTELRSTMFCLTEEIKERKQVQTALQISEQELKQRTQQLESALQDLQQIHLQLIQSEKMSSLGQLVAGVAHEINNPVSFIFGNINHANRYVEDLVTLIQLYRSYISSLPQEIQDKEEEVDLDFVLGDLPKLFMSMQVGVNRIRDIVRSLRNFSRLDEADCKAVDIHTGIDSTLMILEHRLKIQPHRPAIEVKKEYAALSDVECYAGQLNQVFMNILVNAIDALEERCDLEPRLHPIITIKTATEDDYVCIRIADNGAGMDKNVQQHLFNPFFTTKPVGKGTGMGMSISYQIVVEKHQGILTCESILGQGTEFMIKIPVCLSTPS